MSEHLNPDDLCAKCGREWRLHTIERFTLGERIVCPTWGQR